MIEIPPPFDEVWVQALLGFIVGMCLGSFVTMLSYRMPRKQSIILPPSRCPTCHARLGVLDLVPIFSWLSAGGKCRHCKTPISPRYVLIEMATASLAALAFVVFKFQPALLVALIGIVALVTMVVINIEHNHG